VYATALEILKARPSREDDGALVSVAIKAMVAKLDSRSSYMAAKDLRNMLVQNQGQIGEVGLEVTLEKGLVKVVAPIEDSPAAKADLKTNDLLTRIDGQPVEGLTPNQAVEKMRGPVGSMVRLTVVRGEQQPFDIVLTRAVIHMRSVRARLEGDDIGLIRLTKFDEKTAELLNKAIIDLNAQSGPRLKGFILDLRNERWAVRPRNLGLRCIPGEGRDRVDPRPECGGDATLQCARGRSHRRPPAPRPR
jgi:carboxyl-terminal processing protease